jgi:hypothetical protein
LQFKANVGEKPRLQKRLTTPDPFSATEVTTYGIVGNRRERSEMPTASDVPRIVKHVRDSLAALPGQPLRVAGERLDDTGSTSPSSPRGRA